MGKRHKQELKLAAVGDISFAGVNADKPTSFPFKSVQHILNGVDLVFANLEGPLYDGNHAIPGKCTIRGTSGWADILKTVGIDVVTLANNHIMDHGTDGLFSTISVLDRNGIAYIGAGADIEEARKAFITQINEFSVAILARTSVIVESPSYADRQTPGVAFLDMEDLINRVKECRNKADMVVLLMHWGIEEYSYPTPAQRKQAKELNKAGVDIIIGHHPHVVQGCERFRKGLAAYSLGNFVFDEFDWIAKLYNGSTRNLKLSLNSENRKGIIFTATLNENRIEIAPVFTQIDTSGSVTVDVDGQREKDFHQLCSRLKNYSITTYSFWWKLYSFKKEWQMRFSSRMAARRLFYDIFKLRPRHARELFRMIRNSLRISFGKSTNPYD